MASLTRDLTAAAGAAFSAMGLEERWGAVRRSDKPELAVFQCNGAMGAAKAILVSDEALAGRLRFLQNAIGAVPGPLDRAIPPTTSL